MHLFIPNFSEYFWTYRVLLYMSSRPIGSSFDLIFNSRCFWFLLLLSHTFFLVLAFKSSYWISKVSSSINRYLRSSISLIVTFLFVIYHFMWSIFWHMISFKGHFEYVFWHLCFLVQWEVARSQKTRCLFQVSVVVGQRRNVSVFIVSERYLVLR